MAKVLGSSFFARPTTEVAQDLLGKFLVRRRNRRTIALIITETEVYDGFRDRGSHASRGRTERNRPMFGPPGHWYVYFTYGMHWMLNVVTREKNYPAAVLIRGLRGINGPGRLTKALRITGALGGRRANKASGLWIEDRGVVISKNKIKKGPRVGISYAGPYWAGRHWRFYLEA